MLNINSVLLSDDAKTLNVVLTTDELSAQDASLVLTLVVGDCYLQENAGVDVSSYMVITPGSEIVTAAIPITAISSSDGSITCDYTKEIFDGIFIIQATDVVNTVTQTAEKPVVNAYYLSLVLAHKILAIDDPDKLNETNLIYLLLQAAISYVALEKTESALGAYQRVEALCESVPLEYYTTELSACGVGTGCWIINGVYVKF